VRQAQVTILASHTHTHHGPHSHANQHQRPRTRTNQLAGHRQKILLNIPDLLPWDLGFEVSNVLEADELRLVQPVHKIRQGC
jgi:hypothetical protein